MYVCLYLRIYVYMYSMTGTHIIAVPPDPCSKCWSLYSQEIYRYDLDLNLKQTHAATEYGHVQRTCPGLISRPSSPIFNFNYSHFNQYNIIRSPLHQNNFLGPPIESSFHSSYFPKKNIPSEKRNSGASPFSVPSPRGYETRSDFFPLRYVAARIIPKASRPIVIRANSGSWSRLRSLSST